MEYIKDSALEALVFLLFNDGSYEEFSFWIKDSPKDGDENPRSTLSAYIEKIGIYDFIKTEMNGENTVLSLINDGRGKLRMFLKKYIYEYKRGKLDPNSEIRYFNYCRNIEKIEKILLESSQGYTAKSFSLSYIKFCDLSKNKEDDIRRVRILEFLLDCYFQNLVQYIQITSCNRKRIALCPERKTLQLNVKLNKSPDELYEFLLSRKDRFDVFVEDSVCAIREIGGKHIVQHINNKKEVLSYPIIAHVFQYLLDNNNTDTITLEQAISEMEIKASESTLRQYIVEVNAVLQRLKPRDNGKKPITTQKKVLVINIT